MIEAFRACVRPILTLSGWGVLCYLVIKYPTPTFEFFAGAVMFMLGDWFGQRKKNGNSK